MELTGILPLKKPKGFTSHDCVMKLRKMLKTKKIGHTGTLDPDVTGVLPICIGRATKISEYMTDYPKTYEGEVTLGFSTTTEDASGEIVDKKEINFVPTIDEIQHVLTKFTGPIIQIPPMYSAVRVNGKKLYEYARLGQTVERPERHVNIYELQLLSELKKDKDVLSFQFKVHCSKGTYVRTLAVDIGKELGYPSHMSGLIRTASGPFTLQECLDFDELQQQIDNHAIADCLLSIDEALKHFPKVVVNDKIAEKVKNGAVLEADNIDEKRFTVYNEEGTCLAIYQQHPTKTGLIKPEKMLFIQ